MNAATGDRYSPWDDIAERYPHIHVALAHMHPAKAGVDLDAGIILIDRGMCVAERRSSLAHEIGHLDLDHSRAPEGWFSRRQESEADRLASRRLITVHDLAEAYAATHDDAELAEILGVDTRMVRVRCERLNPSERHYIAARVARVEQTA